MWRAALACCALLAIYGALSFFNDSKGFLGTDTGAKVASLRAMVHNGGFDPDVGYWAQAWDPEGKLHPLYQSVRFGDRWVAVTTLPALYAGYPLYRLGGYRLALLVPMLGSVAAALAARGVVRRISPHGKGAWLAFWLIGLASPLTIYALDFWEHSLGAALMAWAILWLFDFADHGGALRALASGAAMGLAATMRTEALVYATVGYGLVALLLIARFDVRRLMTSAVAVGVGFGLVWTGNLLLERATVGEAIRATRAERILAGREGEDPNTLPARQREALVTAFSLEPSLDAGPAVAGAIAAGSLGLGLFLIARATRARWAMALLAAGSALYILRVAQGPGFVPGLFAAAPVAVAGIVFGVQTPAARRMVGVALLSLPLVWAFQFRGGAPPQWGARYLLTSSLLLSAVGAAGLVRAPRWAQAAVVGLAATMTGLGLAWLSVRSHDVARAAEALNRRPEPVLVSRLAFFVREGGGVYGTIGDRRWLTAQSTPRFAEAVRVLECAGVGRFGAVQLDETPRGPRRIGPYRRRSTDRVRFFSDLDLQIVRYEDATRWRGSKRRC